MGFVIKVADKLPNNDSGIILIGPELKDIVGNNKCIIINRNIKNGKKRFVLAHEIGHYLFHFNGNEKIRFKHSFLCSYNKNSMQSINEVNANAFAVELLMPEDLFKRKFLNLKEKMSLADIIVELSDFFGTTTKSVETRIGELKL